MMTRIGIVRGIAWNYTGYLYETAVGLALVAYVVRHVGVADYGLFLLAMSFSGLLMLLDCGLSGLLPQAYISERSRNGAIGMARLASTAFFVFVLPGSVAVLFCLAIAACLPGPFHLPPELLPKGARVIVLAGLVVQLALPTRALETLCEASSRFDILNRTHVLVTTLRAILTVIVLEGGSGIVALAWLQVAGAGLRLLVLSLALSKGGAMCPAAQLWDWQLVKPLWRKVRWPLLDNLTRQLAMSSDLLILGMFASMGAVAVYGVGSRLPAQLFMIVRKGVAVAFPVLGEHHVALDVGGLQWVYVTTCRVVLAALLPVVLLAMLFADSIVELWAGTQYAGGAAVMRWLLLAILFLGVSHVSDRLLYACGHIATAGRIATFESLANLGLSLSLVVPFGGAGLAAATAITHTIASLFWFVPAACRAANLDPRYLAAVFTRDAALPLLAMFIPLAIVRLLSVRLLPLTMGALVVFSLLLYVAVWLNVAGLSLWRSRAPVPD